MTIRKSRYGAMEARVRLSPSYTTRDVAHQKCLASGRRILYRTANPCGFERP
jgi:hypothetical protein